MRVGVVSKPKWVTRSFKVTAAFVLAAIMSGMPAAPGASAAWAAGRERGAVIGASGSLAGVAATSARNAWAVGFAGPAARPRTLILRWRGRAWTKVSAPSLGASGSLAAVAATSARNAWAVGSTGHAGGTVGYGGKAVILHWNGSTWRSVPCPRPGTGSVIYAVAAGSASSAWAVGSYATKANPFGQAYIARWNGSAWKQVFFQFGFLSGVVTSARSSWAVGGTGGDGLDFPLALRWNGHAWKQARTPMPQSGGHLFGIAATSPSNAWAVGLTYGLSTKILIFRWNGAAWKQARTPRLSSGALNGIAATSARNAWAVGHTSSQSNPKTLILRWNGSAWK
ncbi:MAG TPA: hypothetical protein VN695_00570 [Streptosporangiaceae bacterium]|nr:hypothetical protein [Streptosporangiaceae bacterium]